MSLVRPLVIACVLVGCSGAYARGVRVAFAPQDPQTGPFPSDALTVVDQAQKTGLRINMPLPAGCATATSIVTTCAELALINQFDGFALQPRIHVRFTGAIDPNTLRGGLYYLWLDRIVEDEAGMGPVGRISLINEVVYDPATNTAYAKPDDALDQTRRYAIIVTDKVKDRAGDPVEIDDAFRACTNGRTSDYCARLADAVGIANGKTAEWGQVTGASVFTTMSATAWMQAARRELANTNPSFKRTGSRSIFSAAEIQSVTIRQQARTSGDDKFITTSLPVPAFLLALSGLGRVAFGSYMTPRFLEPTWSITTTPTASPIAFPAQAEEIFFQVYLPATPMPAGGYPVAIVGHGLGGNRLDAATALTPGLLGAGFAIISINAVGHGLGPEGTIEVTDRSGSTTTLPFGGRGADLTGDGTIDAFEGAILFAPQFPVGIRDSSRQTALDLMQLTRAIRIGMDLDGDGTVDLSGDRISYVGVSFGSFVGTLLHAVEPDIASAVLNSGGGSAVDAAYWSPTLHPLMALLFGARVPPLLNNGRDFNANLPLRYEPVRVNTVAGAMDIQDELERLEWIETPGAPHAFAPHLKSTTLQDVPIKRTLFEYALGDMTIPNPANLLQLRTANQWESAVMFRSDLARQRYPGLPDNPHAFLARIDNLTALPIVLAAQQQAAQFLLRTDEVVPAVPDEFKDLFVPPTHVLERLNFAQ